MNRLKPATFLSTLCRDTFAGYAVSQIKKARGLNKKVMNPLPRDRKSLLNFCYILLGSASQPALDWLQKRGWQQQDCGLVNVAHARDVYALYHDPDGTLGFSGIIQDAESNAVSVSSVPPGLESVAHLYVNHDGYSNYCKEYREYWEWVEKRNESRYQSTLDHGKNYDAKNMMHTFRLLDMAAEILSRGEVIVRRPNRAELLQIRAGNFEYDDLIARAEQQILAIDELAANSRLPKRPDLKQANQLLVDIRRAWYEQQ